MYLFVSNIKWVINDNNNSNDDNNNNNDNNIYT